MRHQQTDIRHFLPESLTCRSRGRREARDERRLLFQARYGSPVTLFEGNDKSRDVFVGAWGKEQSRKSRSAVRGIASWGSR